MKKRLIVMATALVGLALFAQVAPVHLAQAEDTQPVANNIMAASELGRMGTPQVLSAPVTPRPPPTPTPCKSDRCLGTWQGPLSVLDIRPDVVLCQNATLHKCSAISEAAAVRRFAVGDSICVIWEEIAKPEWHENATITLDRNGTEIERNTVSLLGNQACRTATLSNITPANYQTTFIFGSTSPVRKSVAWVVIGPTPTYTRPPSPTRTRTVTATFTRIPTQTPTRLLTATSTPLPFRSPTAMPTRSATILPSPMPTTGVRQSPVPTSHPASSGGGTSGGGICGSIGFGVVLFLLGGLAVARRERRNVTNEKPANRATPFDD
jgi:hypothetical protein